MEFTVIYVIREEGLDVLWDISFLLFLSMDIYLFVFYTDSSNVYESRTWN